MSYDFSLTTERSSLLGTESFRDHFSKSLQNSQQHIYVLSGYVKSSGVQWLKNELKERNIPCTIVAQWTPQNLIEGSCDLESYLIAKENNWQFKILNNFHGKVTLIDDKILFIGSANLTSRGLSLLPISNKELGIAVKPTAMDQSIIRKLLDEATLVDDAMYEELKDWLNKQDKFISKSYSKFPDRIHSLLKENFDKLWVSNFPWCSFDELSIISDDEHDLLVRQKHDLKLFNIDTYNKEIMSEGFKDLHIYKWLKNSLNQKENREMYFGELTKLIHGSLFDDPKPFRQDVKKLLQNLYSYAQNLDSKSFKIERPNYSQKISLI